MMPLHQVLKSRLFDWTNGSDMNFNEGSKLVTPDSSDR